MTTPIGVVACSTLYPELRAIDPSIPVRYIPHELHESPVDPGVDSASRLRVQRAVDELATGDGPVAVAFARSEDALTQLRIPDGGVRLWRAADCVDALLETTTGHSSNGPDTFYLTPGLIDTGLDPLKLYGAYTASEDELIDVFAAGDDASAFVSWFVNERYQSLRVDGPRPSRDLVRRQFARQFGGYDRVSLIDTGSLRPFDHRYASLLGSFLEDIQQEDDSASQVDVYVESGDRSLLRALITDFETTRDDATSRRLGIEEVTPGQRIATHRHPA